MAGFDLAKIPTKFLIALSDQWLADVDHGDLSIAVNRASSRK